MIAVALAVSAFLKGLALWCDHPGSGAPGARECGQTERNTWAASPSLYMVAPAARPDVL